MFKIKVGDIFELETSRGNVYLHYVYEDEQKRQLIRVLPGYYDSLPDLNELVKKNESFVVFFFLSFSVKKKLLKKVGEGFIIDSYKKPEYMRSVHKVGTDISGWDIVNTNNLKRQYVEGLTEDQKKMSPWGIWPYEFLSEKLESGWTLENWS